MPIRKQHRASPVDPPVFREEELQGHIVLKGRTFGCYLVANCPRLGLRRAAGENDPPKRRPGGALAR
jgi:hypothetical protein